MTSSTISLADILDDLMRRAAHAPGFPARQTLRNGLRVDVVVLVYEAGESETFLQLYRADTFPGHNEWVTVLKHWPYSRDLKTPYTKLRGRFLKGSWVTPGEAVQRELFKHGVTETDTSPDTERK